MSYDKTNSGTIATNTRKTQENHPDITGSLDVNGVAHWINGWKKTNKADGSTFYSLSIKPKEARQEAPPAPAYGDKSRRTVPPAFDAGAVGPDDDIPFRPY